jgi:hypothetical protein
MSRRSGSTRLNHRFFRFSPIADSSSVPSSRMRGDATSPNLDDHDFDYCLEAVASLLIQLVLEPIGGAAARSSGATGSVSGLQKPTTTHPSGPWRRSPAYSLSSSPAGAHRAAGDR